MSSAAGPVASRRNIRIGVNARTASQRRHTGEVRDARTSVRSIVGLLLAMGSLRVAGSVPVHAVAVEVKPVSWDVAGIGASGRTLRLEYFPGSA